MSHQTAAKQIGELAGIGFVNKVPNGREAFCELAEPLMRICIEVKDNRAEHFQLFVEFLRHWFSSSEIEHRMQALHGHGHETLDSLHLREALRCSRRDSTEPFIRMLEREASRCYRRQDYAGLASIHAKLKHDGRRPSDLHEYLYQLRREGKVSDVLVAGKAAAAALPDDDDLRAFLARVLCEEEKFEESLEWINQAVKLNPKSGHYLCFRLSILSQLKRYDELLEGARASLQLEPDHWHAYGQMLEALEALGRIDEGRQVVDHLVRIGSQEPYALISAAQFFSSQREYERALELLQKVLQIDPNNASARHNRGYIYFRQRNYDAAKNELSVAVAMSPKSAGSLCLLSDTLMHLKDYEGAVQTTQKLLQVDPRHTRGYVVQGRSLIELGKVQEGLESFRCLLERDGFFALVNAAYSARQAKDLKLAGELISRAQKLRPDDPEVWKEQALLYFETGEVDLAWLAARRAGLPYLATVSEALAAKGELAQAVRDLIKAFAGELVENRKHVVAGLAATLARSIRRFGPAQVAETCGWLRELETQMEMSGLLSQTLTAVLPKILGSLKGSKDDWEQLVGALMVSVGDVKECRIPIAVLSSAVGFTFTGNKRFLLKLPLEQRQLLERALTKKPRSGFTGSGVEPF
jgi:tetratricopeptide (TPR) repeat protein